MNMKRHHTVASTLEAGKAFKAEFGRLPKRADYGKHGLASYVTIALLFGTMETYRQMVDGVDTGEVKVRECRKCDQDFVSQGKHNRVCGACKETDEWHEPTGRRLNRQTLYGGRVLPVREGGQSGTFPSHLVLEVEDLFHV